MRTRCIDWRTSWSTSVNASTAQAGRWPTSVSSSCRKSSVSVSQAAAGVVDEYDAAGAQRPLADGQRADDVVGDHAARVADGVAVAELQAERVVQVEAGVHAGDHGHLQHGAGVHAGVGELGGVPRFASTRRSVTVPPVTAALRSAGSGATQMSTWR